MITVNECRICNNPENNKSYFIREMYIGTREEFEYFECSKCGCLQIKDISTKSRENIILIITDLLMSGILKNRIDLLVIYEIKN